MFLTESNHCAAGESTRLHADADEPDKTITKAEARIITKQIAYFLRDQYGIGAQGPGADVVVTISSGQRLLPVFFFGVVAAEGVYSAASTNATPADLARAGC